MSRRPFIATFRGVAQRNLPAYARIFQFRRHHRHLNAFEHLYLITAFAVKNAARPFLYLRRFLDLLFSRIIFRVIYSNISEKYTGAAMQHQGLHGGAPFHIRWTSGTMCPGEGQPSHGQWAASLPRVR